MALKIVFLFLFALVALAYGLPATESSEKSESDLQVQAAVDSYLDELFRKDGGAESLILEVRTYLQYLFEK